MTLLVRQDTLDVEVAFHSFGFQESDDSAVPVPFNDDYHWGEFLCQHVRRFDLFSGAHTHTAKVTVRVWDGAPDADYGPVDELGEVDFDSTSGDVAIWTATLGRSSHLIHLGSPGHWRVRVACSGRAEADRVSSSEGSTYGLEKYIIDFWPK